MKRRRRRERRVYAQAILALIGIYVAYAFGMAAWDYLGQLAEQRKAIYFVSKPDFGSLLLNRLADGFVGFWFFFAGASIGSFLNVVVYRMPIGLSLVMTGSRCPFCLTPILARDNLPILGWIVLAGRCRACRLPIAARYPIVEAITGAFVVFLYAAELASGGRFLPNGWWAAGLDIGQVILDARLDLLGIFVYHAMIVCILWTASLMIYDRRYPPRRFWLTAALLVIVPVYAWPPLWQVVNQYVGGPPVEQISLQLVPWQPLTGLIEVQEFVGRSDLVSVWVGLALGGVVGCILAATARRASRHDATDAEDSEDVPDTENDLELSKNETPRANLLEKAAVEDDYGLLSAAVFGMTGLVGAAWGWQFLLMMLPVAFVAAGGLKASRRRTSMDWVSALAFGCVVATVLLTSRWRWAAEAWAKLGSQFLGGELL